MNVVMVLSQKCEFRDLGLFCERNPSHTIRLCGIHINIYESPYVSTSPFYCLAIVARTLINEIGPFMLAHISRASH